MMGSMEETREEETFPEILEKISRLGVQADIDGDIPDRGIACTVIRNSILECATNCLRHAKGNRLHIQIRKENEEYHVQIRNNGIPPAKKIQNHEASVAAGICDEAYDTR